MIALLTSLKGYIVGLGAIVAGVFVAWFKYRGNKIGQLEGEIEQKGHELDVKEAVLKVQAVLAKDTNKKQNEIENDYEQKVDEINKNSNSVKLSPSLLRLLKYNTSSDKDSASSL